MGAEQINYDDSLNNEQLKSVIGFKIDTNNIFNPIECFEEETNEFTFPKGIKEAYLVYLMESRKLQRFELDSTVIEDKIYGAYEDSAKTKKKKYVITSITTKINLETKSGKELFMAACASRFVYGTPNSFARPYFRIEIPELRSAMEIESLDLLEEAIVYVSKLDEEQMNDLSFVLNISSFINKTKTEKSAFLRKMCVSNPQIIVEAMHNKNATTIVVIKKAIDNKVIKEVNGVFTFADYTMGTTIEQCIMFFDQNMEIFEMIKNNLELPSVKKSTKKVVK